MSNFSLEGGDDREARRQAAMWEQASDDGLYADAEVYATGEIPVITEAVVLPKDESIQVPLTNILYVDEDGFRDQKFMDF